MTLNFSKLIDLQKLIFISVEWHFSSMMPCKYINVHGLVFPKSTEHTGGNHLHTVLLKNVYTSHTSVSCDPSKVSLWTHGERHRLQGPPAVPPESEEPRHQRLPPCQAEVSVGLAQLSPVSFSSEMTSAKYYDWQISIQL